MSAPVMPATPVRFRLIRQRGETWLEPLSGVRLIDAIELAESVPGAVVSHGTGEVVGATHALRAVMHAAGQEWTELEGPAAPAHVASLPPFQQEGVRFLLDRNGILGDAVGLGKTVQAIAAGLALPPDVRIVVLCPAFLRPQWRSEIHRWTRILAQFQTSKMLLPVSAGKAKHAASGPDDARWIVAAYTEAGRVLELLGKSTYALIVDEVHNIRTLRTLRAESVATLSTFALRCWGLTASLLYNQGTKLHSVLSIVDGTGWGSYRDFALRYTDAVPGEYGLMGGKNLRMEHASELRERMKEVYLRRSRDHVWKQLPFEAKFQVIKLDAPVWAMPGKSTRSIDVARIGRMLAEFKMPAVLEQIASDQLAGVPSLTVTWLREHAEALAAAVPGSMLSLGGDEDRLTSIEAYVTRVMALGQVPTLISTMDGISEGANLQWAKAVNFAAMDYMSEKVRQIVGRAVRMGQSGVVPVRFFVAKRTLDEVMVGRILEQLKSQALLDGRPETDKGELADALSARDLDKDMAALWARLEKGGEP